MKRSSLWRGVLCLLVALPLLLVGCVEEDAPPKLYHVSSGVVRLTAAATAADESPQYLDRYGVFYSTSYDDIVAVTGQSYLSSPDSEFVVRSSVQNVEIDAQGRQVAAKESGTLEATVSGLKPGAKYYFRFYTIGRDSDNTTWLRGFTVASYTTYSGVVLGIPAAPSTMYKGNAATVLGSLKPRHTAGTTPVRIYRWKKLSSGSWKAYGYVNATVKNYSAYSQYYRSMSFPERGAWRIRAFHPAHGSHGNQWSSGYDYVTVR